MTTFDFLDRVLEPLQLDEVVTAIADAQLACDPSTAGPPFSKTGGKAVERAKHHLDAHFDRVIASGELEGLTGLERYALVRHFRTRLGTSPYPYLTIRRLDHVRTCIRAGWSLVDTAADRGYADQSHVTRQFKKAYGLSPGRWRTLRT